MGRDPRGGGKKNLHDTASVTRFWWFAELLTSVKNMFFIFFRFLFCPCACWLSVFSGFAHALLQSRVSV